MILVYIYMYIYIHTTNQTFVLFIVNVLFLMKRVKYHNVFIFYTKYNLLDPYLIQLTLEKTQKTT